MPTKPMIDWTRVEYSEWTDEINFFWCRLYGTRDAETYSKELSLTGIRWLGVVR